MYKILICVLTLFSSEICLCKDSTLDDTELVLAFMTHRHGDRTPIKDTIHFAIDPAAVLERTLRYGFGQLTDNGRVTAYELGKFIRRRYDIFLSERYNKSEIYIRSTDSSRTKMTVLTAMAAVYPPGNDNWSQDINWTPVPYTTVPARYDGLLATVNCPAVMNTFYGKLQEPVPEMAKYQNLLNELSDILGMDITQMPAALYLIYDIFESQISLGVPLTPSLDKLLPELEEAAGVAFGFVFADEKSLALQAGVLLKEFFDAVDSVLSGKDTPRVQVYSAHDANVNSFSAACKVIPQIGAPKYGSLFALELRRNLETGTYIVVPVFLKQPGAEEVYLQVDGCQGFCDLDRFRELTSEYVRNTTEYRAECGFSEDLVLDTSSID